MMKKIPTATLTFFLLLSICYFGFFLRMIPSQTQHHEGYSGDRAFHLRMTKEVLDHGIVPEIDQLSIHPIGKNITSELPTFMYYLAATFHKSLNFFSHITLEQSCAYFSALMGALIAIPIYFMALTLYQNKFISFIAAILAVIIPAHMRRTFCFWFKYEGLGTLCFLFNFLFFLKSLTVEKLRENILFGLLSASFMLLMLASWRLALLIYFLYFLFGALMILFYKTNKNLETSLLIMLVCTALGSFLLIPYLASNKFYSSKIFFFSLAIVLTSYTLKFMYRRFPVFLKYKFLFNLSVLASMVMGLFLFSRATQYSSFYSLFIVRIAALFGEELPAEGFTRVLLITKELVPIAIKDLFKADIFSLSIFFFPLSLFSLFIKIKKYRSNKSPIPYLCFLFFFITLFISTLLFFRNKVLSAPLLAVLAAGVILYPLNILYEKNTKSKLFLSSAIFLGLSFLIILKTGFDSCYISIRTQNAFLPTRDVLDWTNENVEKGTGLLTFWGEGYTTQLHTGCPTLVDGFLENPEIRKRIRETETAFYAQNEEDLYNICKKYQISYILFPIFKSDSIAKSLGFNPKLYQRKPTEKSAFRSMYQMLRRGEGRAPTQKQQIYDFRSARPTNLGLRTLIYQMIHSPEELHNFKLRFKTKGYRIFEVI